MYLLDIEALDLGPEVRAVSLDLVEADENREPVRGEDAARIWSRVIRATAGSEPWALDFFSHLDRVRDFCEGRGIEYREANKRSLVIPAPEPASLEALIGRFQGETFRGARWRCISHGRRRRSRARRRPCAARSRRLPPGVPELLFLRHLRV